MFRTRDRANSKTERKEESKVKKIRKIVSLVLAAVMLLGAVPALAASGSSGLNGKTGEYRDFDFSVYDYHTSTYVARTASMQWPSSGGKVLLETNRTYKDWKTVLEGLTIPAGLIVDVYDVYSVGYDYVFLASYDTTDGKPLTLTFKDGGDGNGQATVAGFRDVHESDYYARAVEWAKETGVTAGTNADGTTFSPKATVTRAEAMTFLWRAAGKPEPKSTGSPFTDVTDPNAYYYKAVLWAAEQGITNGTGGTDFGLNGTLAYDQILTFLCRAAGENADGSDWSAAAVAWAKQSGLTDGLSFTAKNDCPRSDVVYCLWKQLADKEENQTEETEGVPTSLTDVEAARAAIIIGFQNRESRINVSKYNIEASEAEALAAEIADLDGKNPYNISFFNCYEEAGEQAMALGVYYLMQNVSAEDKSGENAEVQAQVQSIVNSVVTSGMSDYEIAKALHDWLVLNCEYDMRLYSGDMPYSSYTAYGALMDGTAVCAGYAQAYRLLMEYAGVDCEYVTGRARGGGHAWNIVKIDGEWYHVDTTWDDPIPNKEGYVRYNYFLRSDTAMSKDHSNWTASYACTSTKYDGTTLPSSTEQAKQAEREAEQKRLDEAAAQVLAFLTEAIDGLPYRTAAELQAAETLTSDDAYPKISFPSGRFSASDLGKIRDQLKTALSEQYPDYEIMSVSSSGCQIKRSDVLQEMERRKGVLQAETETRAAEIETILRQAIRESDVRVRTYDVTIPGNYTLAEVKKACANMSAAGYSFDGYTAKEDYSFSSYSAAKVTVRNLRYEEWAEEETLRYVEMLQKAIRNRETQVLLPPGDYPDTTDIYFASAASRLVKAAGYSFDGLTSGVDYTITRDGIRSTREFMVLIEYPETPESKAEEQAQQEQAVAEILEILREAIDDFPYTTEAELQAAETLTYQDTYREVTLPATLPSGQSTGSVIDQVRDRVMEEFSARYPGYELQKGPWLGFVIWSNDALREYERRQAAPQTKTDADVTETEMRAEG